MIRTDLSVSARSVLVGFAVNPPIVAFHGTKVLPSACASVQDLAGYPVTVEISHVHPETVATSTQPHAGDSSPFSWRPLVFQEKFAAYIIIDVAQTLSP